MTAIKHRKGQELKIKNDYNEIYQGIFLNALGYIMYDKADDLLLSLNIRKGSENYNLLLETAEQFVKKHPNKKITLHDLCTRFIHNEFSIQGKKSMGDFFQKRVFYLLMNETLKKLAQGLYSKKLEVLEKPLFSLMEQQQLDSCQFINKTSTGYGFKTELLRDYFISESLFHGFLKSKELEKDQPVTSDLEPPQKILPEDTVDNSSAQKPEEEDSEMRSLILNKLIPLTENYQKHLDRKTKDASVEAKQQILSDLLLILNEPKLDSSKIVKEFYTKLDASEDALTAHRDEFWVRFVTNAVIVGGILISGILPGLAALAVYANCEKNEPRSMLFWQSKGRNYFDAVQDESSIPPIKK